MKKYTKIIPLIIVALLILLTGCEAVLGVVYNDFSTKTAAEADVSVDLLISKALTFRSSYIHGAKIHVLLLPFFGSIGETDTLVLNKDLILEQTFDVENFEATENNALTADFKIKENAVYYAVVYLDENKSEEKDPDTDQYTYGNGEADFSDPMMVLEYIPAVPEGSEETDPAPVNALNFTFKTAGDAAVEMEAIVRADMRVADDDLWILDQLISNPEANERPEADFFLEETTVAQFEEFILDGSYCTDDDGWITTWVWDMGDGTQLLGKTAYYTYRDVTFIDGIDTKTISLTVMDNRGSIDTLTRDITIDESALDFIPKSFKISGQLAISTRDMNKPLKSALFREETTSGDVVENNLIFQKSIGLVTQRNLEFYFYVNEPGVYAAVVWLDDDDDDLIDPGEWATTVQDIEIDTDGTSELEAASKTFGISPGNYTVDILTMAEPISDPVEVPGYFLLDSSSRVSSYFYLAINQDGAEQDGSKEEPQEIGLDLNEDCSAALGKSSYYFLDLTPYTQTNNTYDYTITILEPTRNVDLKIYKPFENTNIVNPIDVVERGIFRIEAWEDHVMDGDDIAAIRLLEESYLPSTQSEAVQTRIIGAQYGTHTYPTNYVLIEVIPREYYATYDIEVAQTLVEFDAESNENPETPYALTLDSAYTQEDLAQGDYLYYQVQNLTPGTLYTATIDSYDAPNDLRLELFADGSFTNRISYSYTMDLQDTGTIMEQLDWTAEIIGNNDGTNMFLRVYAKYLDQEAPAAGISFNIIVAGPEPPPGE